MAAGHDGSGPDLPATDHRVSWTVPVLLGAAVAVILSNVVRNICEVNCTFARQKALMYVAVPAAAAALVALVTTGARRTVWAIAFGIAGVLLCAWLVVLLVVSP
jgi:hypothetical protein